MKLDPKPSSASATTLTQIVLPFQANPAGNMHGGEVMKMMDSAAGVVAAKHSKCNVVTASVTHLAFLEPVYVGDLITCKAQLTYTGNTSMEIFVQATAENMEEDTVRNVSNGYFFMVALDKDGKPTKVPPLLIENEDQDICFCEAKERIARLKEPIQCILSLK
jgi:acyl-CoA hydrolase